MENSGHTVYGAEEKRALRDLVERTVLLLALFLAHLFHLLQLVPETENLIYEKLSVFDLLQFLLGIAVLVAGYRFYTLFLRGMRELTQHHLGEEWDHIYLRLVLVKKIIQFCLLVIFYLLTIPQLKSILEKTDLYNHAIFLPINLFFIGLGIYSIVNVWKAFQNAVTETFKIGETPSGIPSTSEPGENPPEKTADDGE